MFDHFYFPLRRFKAYSGFIKVVLFLVVFSVDFLLCKVSSNRVARICLIVDISRLWLLSTWIHIKKDDLVESSLLSELKSSRQKSNHNLNLLIHLSGDTDLFNEPPVMWIQTNTLVHL